MFDFTASTPGSILPMLFAVNGVGNYDRKLYFLKNYC